MEFNIHYCFSLLFNDPTLTMIVFSLAKNIHFNFGHTACENTPVRGVAEQVVLLKCLMIHLVFLVG